MIRTYKIILLPLSIVLTAGCITRFNPEINEIAGSLVVEGMITNQNAVNKVKLSRSLPVGNYLVRDPVTGAAVSITDETGTVTLLTENEPGVYITDSTEFRGHTGSSYSLNIIINNSAYSTDLIKMLPVPPVNSLYYEKVSLTEEEDSLYMKEGCRIYLDSHDPSGKCLFYRWDFVETYEYHVPYDVLNKVCWVTDRSDRILIKNTSAYSQARVTKFPVQIINNTTDKLKERYSILVSQYSLNETEYKFWETIQNISQNVGGLYDIIPSSVKGNIICNTNPGEMVLGYFSVSAVTRKRLFIKDTFLGQPNFYTYCATDTLMGILPDEGLNTDFWVIEDYGDEPVPYYVVTTYRECADCTTRGTKVRPPFW